MTLRRAPGSCGSASGKALRTTIVGRSRVSAARLRDGRINKQEDVIPLAMPSRTELEESLRVRVCWWCGTSHGHNGKEIRMWGQHFSRGHHLDLQALRDILGVPKNYAFPMHSDTRDAFAKNATLRLKNNPVSKFTANRGQGTRNLSQYGLQAQRDKLVTAREAQKRIERERVKRGLPARVISEEEKVRLREMGRSNGLTWRRMRVCVVCGEEFWRPKAGANGVVCCSETCARVRDSENGKRGADARLKRLHSRKPWTITRRPNA